MDLWAFIFFTKSSVKKAWMGRLGGGEVSDDTDRPRLSTVVCGNSSGMERDLELLFLRITAAHCDHETIELAQRPREFLNILNFRQNSFSFQMSE